MPKISVTLPSIYPEACARALANIHSATRAQYEVLVVSPFDATKLGPNVRWIDDGGKRIGPNASQAMAVREASGEFVAAMTDDFLMIEGWDNLILEDFLEREKLYEGAPYQMGMRYDY